MAPGEGPQSTEGTDCPRQPHLGPTPPAPLSKAGHGLQERPMGLGQLGRSAVPGGTRPPTLRGAAMSRG